MTVMFPKYFGVPRAVLTSEFWSKMRPTEKDLYLYLLKESERLRTRLVKAKDADVGKWTGASPRALCYARKKLQERGLVRYEMKTGNVPQYEICDPETLQPFPGNPKAVIKYDPPEKAEEGATIATQHDATQPSGFPLSFE
jgi:hypothetical protein